MQGRNQSRCVRCRKAKKWEWEEKSGRQEDRSGVYINCHSNVHGDLVIDIDVDDHEDLVAA